MAKLIININNIIQNYHIVRKICRVNHLELVVVTKCCCGDHHIIRHLIDAGVEIIAEAQYKNYQDIEKKSRKMVLHSSLSALENHFTCDFIFISDPDILKKYSKTPLSRKSQVIIPVEMGDAREGVFPEILVSFFHKTLSENVKIAGFSANFGCYQATEPKIDWLNNFIQCVEDVEYRFHYKSHLLSVGGTSIWNLVYTRLLPKRINQLRIGEGIFLGYDPAFKRAINGLSQETFTLKGEIIEIKDHKGQNNGFKRLAIIDFGYASTLAKGLRSKHEGVEIIGSSQDISVIDISNISTSMSTGDYVEFYLSYESLVRAMMSPYVEKIYVDEINDDNLAR